jgi:hypothetical protein
METPYSRIAEAHVDIKPSKKRPPREVTVERWLGEKLTRLGCLYWKFVSPGTNGVPDRIVVLPTNYPERREGIVYFVETKSLTGVESEKQKYRQEQLEARGIRHRVVKGRRGAEELVREIEHAIETADL